MKLKKREKIMINRKDVSIIIPIYNASKYLKRCLDSVINQTKTELEIILINDGSTDNSEEIIKEYKDKRIRYFKNKNHILPYLNYLKKLYQTKFYKHVYLKSHHYQET